MAGFSRLSSRRLRITPKVDGVDIVWVGELLDGDAVGEREHGDRELIGGGGEVDFGLCGPLFEGLSRSARARSVVGERTRRGVPGREPLVPRTR